MRSARPCEPCHSLSSLEGTLLPSIPTVDRTSIEQRESTLEGEDKAKFLTLMRRMLQWDPEKRSSAKDLQQDEWMRGHL